MCWSCKIENFKSKVAEKDIPIFKLVYPDIVCDYRSAIRNFYYNKNITYKTEIGFPQYYENKVVISKGFHSYNGNSRTIRLNIFRCLYIFIPFKLIRLVYIDKHLKKVKGIIPEESIYYENEDNGEIVSNQIMLF